MTFSCNSNTLQAEAERPWVPGLGCVPRFTKQNYRNKELVAVSTTYQVSCERWTQVLSRVETSPLGKRVSREMEQRWETVLKPRELQNPGGTMNTQVTNTQKTHMHTHTMHTQNHKQHNMQIHKIHITYKTHTQRHTPPPPLQPP